MLKNYPTSITDATLLAAAKFQKLPTELVIITQWLIIGPHKYGQLWPDRLLQLTTPPPPNSIWPHLRCDIGLEEWDIEKNCLCVTVLCTIIMVHRGTSSSHRLVNCIGLRSCLVELSVFTAPLYLQSLWCYAYIINCFAYIFLFTFTELNLVGLGLTSLTNYRPSVLRRCWLGHSVWSGTLKPTIPYYTYSQ